MSAVPVAVVSPAAGIRQAVGDYVALTKPRIILLLEVTALAAMLVAQAGFPPLVVVASTLVGGALAASGANAINMWFDRDIDAEMNRTRLRPIPSGRIQPVAALAFGITLNAIAFVVVAAGANVLAATLTMAATLYYVFVYTMWLKRSTPQNIVIGGAAGAFPPLIGWAAATGGLDLVAVYMFAIIFFWTPPHFWALAIRLKGDYGRANVPMLTEVAGGAVTRRQVVLYTVLLVLVSLMPLLRGFGPFYAGSALLLGGGFLYMSLRLLRDPGTLWARRTFLYSIPYLGLVFTAMVVDSLVRG